MHRYIASYITDIIKTLQEHQYEAFVVGGAVRDIMLGRIPKDYDIATSATPEEVREVFGRKKAIIIGRRFRLVHLRINHNIIEVSTFRRVPSQKKQISNNKDPNAPEHMIFHDNEYGTAEEDAWRRDFTVNSIFYDPVADRLIDYTQKGVNDLQQHIVRVIGDANLRFEEDPVRLLRALKLVGQYHFSLEKSSAEALSRNISLIEHASPSRLLLEVEKIFKSYYGHNILKAFQQYHFLRYILPYIEMQWGKEETLYALSMLEHRNERVIKGKYRDSISLSIAAILFPFVEVHLGNGLGHLWQKNQVTRPALQQLINTIFYPHIFCQRICFSVIQMLLLQPDFENDLPEGNELRFQKGYSKGRELCIIRHRVYERDSKIEEKWPPGLDAHSIHTEKRPRRRNSQFKKRRSSKVPF